MSLLHHPVLVGMSLLCVLFGFVKIVVAPLLASAKVVALNSGSNKDDASSQGFI